MPFKNKKVAIFIMPRSSSAWQGAEAMWISAAGWASAAKKKFGNAIVVTSDRVGKPDEILGYPLPPKSGQVKRQKRFLFFLPTLLKTFFNDLLVWKNNLNWKILDDLDYEKDEVAFVWEKHDLFPGPGRKLAKELQVPFISYVHAPVVWEASKWGVKRYGWGFCLTKLEALALRKADYVAAVSEEVKSQLIKMGVSPEKIFISPMAVDPGLFPEKGSGKKELQKKLKLENKFVIGWTGSFRSFHGLEHVVKAFRNVLERHPECVLLLVGDGADREKTEKLVRKLGIQDNVIFAGRKPFTDIPKYISVFDLAIVSAESAEGFHYSPLKLREYLAAGRAVLAPDAGEISSIFENEVHLKLFQAGDVQSLEEGIEYLMINESKRIAIAESGRQLALRTSTWEVELEKALRFFEKNAKEVQ